MEREVVIVGSGPAGSAAAANLSRRGHDVLMIDREEFPRDKVCGDGVPPGTIEILNNLGMRDRLTAAGFYRIDRIVLGSPWGRRWETSFHARRPEASFYIAPRLEFDDLIRRHAVASGSEFRRGAVKGLVRQGTRVVGVRVGEADTEEEIGAKVVIGADGATSIVARSLSVPRPTPRDRGVAIRGYLEGIHTIPHAVEFYFHRRYRPGYGWVFPLGHDRANVGVIMRGDRYRRQGLTLRQLLDHFLRSQPLTGRLGKTWRLSRTASWQLTYASGPPLRRAFDGALLVGDAGHFVDALTGEGIHNALVSSQLAADVVHESLRWGDVSASGLQSYEARCEDVLGPHTRRSQRLQRWVAGIPPVLELLFMGASVGGGRVRNILNRASSDFVLHQE